MSTEMSLNHLYRHAWHTPVCSSLLFSSENTTVLSIAVRDWGENLQVDMHTLERREWAQGEASE